MPIQGNINTYVLCFLNTTSFALLHALMIVGDITVVKSVANRNVDKRLVILTGILDNQMAGLHNMESALQKETNGTTAMAVLKLGLPQPMPISVKNQFEKELKRITESVCSSCKVEINTYLIQKYLLTLYKS